jgi:signal transduction histidine kinase
VSGRIAKAMARDAEHLQRIEAVKGSVFVVTTGLLFFAISFLQLRRIREDEILIARQQESLLQGQRREVAARFAATLAHELNNLLQSLNGLLETWRDTGSADPASAELREGLRTAADRLGRLARRISSTAHEGLPDPREKADLAAEVRQVVALVRNHPDVRRCSVLPVRQDPVPVTFQRALFEEALMNLVINAAQAAGPGGRIEVNVIHDDPDAVVEVHDNGPGIPPEIGARVFDPCFSTKPGGSGLGLLAVTAFAHSHRGSARAGRSPLGGAQFTLRIPC